MDLRLDPGMAHQTLNFFRQAKSPHEIEVVKSVSRRIRTGESMHPDICSPTLQPLGYRPELPNRRKISGIYALTLLLYTVASPNLKEKRKHIDVVSGLRAI